MSRRTQIRVEALFPNFFREASGVSYTLKSVLEGMRNETLAVGATVIAKERHVTLPQVRGIMPRQAARFVWPRLSDPLHWVFRSARRRLGEGDVAYFWLESPAALSAYFRERKIMVVREMINCALGPKRVELRKAYSQLGWPDGSGITDEMIETERTDLLAVDAVVCPNPFVRQTVMSYGVAPERCIDASYGWGAQRLVQGGSVARRADTFTVAFVGTLDVRKGAPLLLEAWAASGIRGRLLLAGKIAADVGEKYASILARPDVVSLGHVEDIGSVYRAADVFCFPTWEEGGPQVTLEAMAAGVVPVVTPMGTAGAFDTADDMAIIVPPGDVEALGGALRSLAGDADRLRYLKQRIQLRAADYHWDRVGERRRGALLKHRRAWLDAR